MEGELGLRRAHYSMLPQFTLAGQSGRGAGVNGSTEHGCRTSCVVARAAGNQVAGPWVSKRDLGQTLHGALHWPLRSRASSRNRHAATPPASTRL